MRRFAFPAEIVGILLIVAGVAMFSAAVALIVAGVALVLLGEVHGEVDG